MVLQNADIAHGSYNGYVEVIRRNDAAIGELWAAIQADPELAESTALFVQGSTAETIVRKATEIDADLIVVGSHGHGAMYQLLVGSVSEAVLRQSEIPVLVVPTHDRK